MSLSVVIERRAASEIDEIDTWWRANRPAAPELFRLELQRCLRAIAVMPSLGARASNVAALEVRRVLLASSRYHVYYRI